MGNPGWKKFERRVASDFGTRRIPVTGIDRDGADLETPLLCVQTKLRRGMPSYLRSWLDGICANAKRKAKIGLVVWKEPGRRDDNAFVVMRLADFVELHGDFTKPADAVNGANPFDEL